MKLQISNFQKTNNLKESFSRTFPFLKLEFFKVAHKNAEPTAKSDMVAGEMFLEELNPLLNDGELVIKAEDSVAETEKAFHEFGLSVQIFRKQKNTWIETTKTDHLSLAKQNEMGQQAAEPVATPPLADRYLEDGQY